ncbi:hypothetical protein [Polymorphospora sp. NPDC050346]|uniref:hypothetical protein n=1 Tax=Polymorphospora sp. NPDC050346 TaxID=3155780 RepID=UPI0034045F92
MSGTEPGNIARPLPAFFTAWRDGWGPQAAAWVPVDFLNQASSLPATIAAGWLFNPGTVEYRSGIFLADRFDATTVDSWFERYPQEPGRIEAVVNQWALDDMFANCDLTPYEDALPTLARDIAACWRAVLAQRYPGRAIQVEIADGPAVTFWTVAPQA